MSRAPPTMAPLPRLSEHDAWEIALAWREQLQGCVRLETDAAPSAFRTVDSFEWVTFLFHGARDDGFERVAEPVDAARCARAATLAWFALSCCSGFSGTENPRFWRRVFSELHTPRGHAVVLRRTRAQVHITDAVRFFDHPDRPFPRVRIEPSVQHQEDCVRAFLGYALAAQPKEELSPVDTLLGKLGGLLPFSTHTPGPLSVAELDARSRSHASRLEAMLTKLGPFIRRSHWRRRFPIGIGRVAATDLAWMVPGLKGCARDSHALDYHQLELDTVFLRDDELHLETAVRSLLTKTDVQIVIPKLELPRFMSYTSGQISTLIVPQGPSEDHRRLTIGALWTVCLQDSMFAALCASLPHSQLVRTVRLDVKSVHISTIIGLQAAEWAWLGYALFHPDAARDSAFTQLDLDQYRIDEENIAFLRFMARGNNLHALNQDPTGAAARTLSDHYHRGQVLADTVVYTKPEDDATPLMTLHDDTWLTLSIGSQRAYILGTWVCAVVPGFGLGWIRKKRIARIESRAPGICCLRGLRVNVNSAFGGLRPLLQLLSIIGEHLEYLYIAGCRYRLDASAVASIVRLCPSLTALRMYHDGSYWSDPNADVGTSKKSKLRELELIVGSYQHLPILSPLRSTMLDELQALRVVALAKTSFTANRATFVDALSRYPKLTYANWARGWFHTGCSPLRSYEQHQAMSSARLGDLHGAEVAFVDRPMAMACRLAFLSVIHHEAAKALPSSLGRFGRDVVSTIFAYASTQAPRDLYVDDGVD